MAMLEVQDVHAYYGNIHALKGITLNVEKGEIVTLIGANGAGKSTTLKTLSGLLKPRSGSIKLDGDELTKYRSHEIVPKGVIQVPEGRRIFGRMTVKENLEMGTYTVRDEQFIQTALTKVFELFPRLEERRNQLGGTLSGGEQQMLAMGRALMSNPKVLLLDEPSMGLAPVLVDSIFDNVKLMHAAGTTILLVEQNARIALETASRGYVLQTGAIVLADTAANLKTNETVRKVYMGEA
ncbi:MAG: ABC transporter ATP-binding protein [Desulfobacteraceae bacterium]|nr:MAG: ABC transporter ATP-binding protein [Desulfobacteraceae bacterium]